MHIRAAIDLTTEILLSNGFASTSKGSVTMTKEILDVRLVVVNLFCQLYTVMVVTFTYANCN
jgi:hypothetical protein